MHSRAALALAMALAPPAAASAAAAAPAAAAAAAAPAAAASAYNRSAAVAHAAQFFDRPQHDCATAYTACTPWSYWGEEACGFPSHGGDCANFLSQNLLAGGHAPLVLAPCRGFPCGREEVGAEKLGACLASAYGWTSTCGPHQPPPAGLRPGDALVFHAASCGDTEAHATLVVEPGPGGRVGVAAHSTDVFNKSVDDYASEFGFYDWLQAPVQ